MARVFAWTAVLVLTSSTAVLAQDGGDRQSFSTKLTRLSGETCIQDPSLPMDSQKCASLLPADGFATVASVKLWFWPPRALGRGKPKTVAADFCAKIEDPGLNGAKCQLLVDDVAVPPGEQTVNSEDAMGNITEAIYSWCMSWSGNTAGNIGADIELQCKNDGKGDGTSPFDIADFAFKVFSR